MGCFTSIVRWRLTKQSLLTEVQDPELSKSIDITSQSCTRPSSVDTSIGIKYPIISINPPFTPSLPPNDHPKPEPIEIPISEINNKLASLTDAITAYTYISEQNRIKMLSDLNAILSAISENSLVYTKLEILHSQLCSLYRTKDDVSRQDFGPAVEKLVSLFKEFVELDEEDQRVQARRQAPSSPIMQMFTIWGNVRKGCNIQRELDGKIERKVGSAFVDVLDDLKDLGAWEPVMKWRVLGMVCGKRREEGERRLELILEVRMDISGLLIEVVEGLREVD